MIGISVNCSNVKDRISKKYQFYTLENALKFNFVHQDNGSLNWHYADQLINELPSNSRIRGHIQITHWTVNQDVPSALLREFLIGTIQRYPRISEWDLIGEAIADVGLIRNYWSRTEFSLQDIVSWAKEANPDNNYYYSDYNLKTAHKWSRAVSLCNELNLGLAIQFRHHAYGRVWLMDLNKWIRRLKRQINNSNILISELDVLCAPALKAQYQDKIIRVANQLEIDVCLWGKCL